MSKTELIIPQNKNEAEKNETTLKFHTEINSKLDLFIKILRNDNNRKNNSIIRIRSSN